MRARVAALQTQKDELVAEQAKLVTEREIVMREHGIAGLRLRRRVRTTVPEPADQKVPDLLHRDFTADAANQRYVGDITYLPLADGSNLYRERGGRTGDGDRLLLPPVGGVGDRRAHAHRVDRRRAHRGPRHEGLAGRSGVPLRHRAPSTPRRTSRSSARAWE